jgi:hypothetical protein
VRHCDALLGGVITISQGSQVVNRQPTNSYPDHWLREGEKCLGMTESQTPQVRESRTKFSSDGSQR